VCGVSTRRVDQLVESLGLCISESEVSRVRGALDERVDAFRTRPLEGRHPYYSWTPRSRRSATRPRGQQGVGDRARRARDRPREILSIDVGEAETEAFWTTFLRGLVKRGLVGVQLAISDAHAGLKAALAKVLGCTWQRCTVHVVRDCFGHARKDQHGLLGALIRPIFAADSIEQARDRLSEAVAHLDGRLGRIASMLEDAEAEILAFYAFPPRHWSKLRSTNPLERFNKEVGRRTDVVGIFPNDRSLIRLAGMVCIEQNDESRGGRGYLSAESISLVLAAPAEEAVYMRVAP
jgi:putative transposase